MSLDQTPAYLERVELSQGRIELVEWHWPEIIGFERTETDLMLEMSLPPHATDASAEFPGLASGHHSFVGTLFVRYPGVALRGRGGGGHIRVLRFVFGAELRQEILGEEALPPLAVLQSLLDIRSDSLRKVMTLAVREITVRQDCSPAVLDALQTLAAVELRRLVERPSPASQGGRLAAWQYRRIRDRLAQHLGPPTAAELAALCGISVRHLNRQFQALTGSTVADYVTNYWVDRAKAMLVTDAAPIKNIAFTLGFAHANSFARAFRRATGASPQDYRQRASADGIARTALAALPHGWKADGPR
jgi:AraC family transcriptional regulator